MKKQLLTILLICCVVGTCCTQAVKEVKGTTPLVRTIKKPAYKEVIKLRNFIAFIALDLYKDMDVNCENPAEVCVKLTRTPGSNATATEFSGWLARYYPYLTPAFSRFISRNSKTKAQIAVASAIYRAAILTAQKWYCELLIPRYKKRIMDKERYAVPIKV